MSRVDSELFLLKTTAIKKPECPLCGTIMVFYFKYDAEDPEMTLNCRNCDSLVKAKDCMTWH